MVSNTKIIFTLSYDLLSVLNPSVKPPKSIKFFSFFKIKLSFPFPDSIQQEKITPSELILVCTCHLAPNNNKRIYYHAVFSHAYFSYSYCKLSHIYIISFSKVRPTFYAHYMSTTSRVPHT